MDGIDAYLERDGFEILGHEVGHRWLSRLRFRDPGGSGHGLLGRGLVHWSFFLDSDASVMEGNEIEDRGGGRFETVDFARGFSALDQYVMGLRAPQEVPAFFFVEGADDFRPHRSFRFSTAPEAGVTFTGVRRDVRIEDVRAGCARRSCWSRMLRPPRRRRGDARWRASAPVSRRTTAARRTDAPRSTPPSPEDLRAQGPIEGGQRHRHPVGYPRPCTAPCPRSMRSTAATSGTAAGGRSGRCGPR
jgi:hypothetical protein